ncbi:MAG TPA: HAD family hydrolase [Ktedonobacterales bacterium]
MFVFFDIGDTLVDEAEFARLRHASVFRALERRGIAEGEEQFESDLNNLSMRGRMALLDQLRWFARRGGGDSVQAMEVFREYILQVAPKAPQLFRPFPDARSCLERLAAATDYSDEPYRLGIIANQPTWIRGRLADWGLLAYLEPDCVVISDEVGIGKPRPEIFEFALAQAGVAANEAVMVGNDYVFDIEPAKWLGMHTLWIERDDPYAPGALPVKDPWAADLRLTSLCEVPSALTRLPGLPQRNGHTRKAGHKSMRTSGPAQRTSKSRAS